MLFSIEMSGRRDSGEFKIWKDSVEIKTVSNAHGRQFFLVGNELALLEWFHDRHHSKTCEAPSMVSS